MAKPIPKVGSRRNGRSSARKSARRILKGVIHVQASFNNTIVTVTDVRGRVISWSSIGTCGFKGTRKSAPFAAQTTTGNVIQAIVEQGMQRAEVMVKGPSLERDAALRPIVEVKVKVSTSTQTRHWKCVESRIDSQANTIGIAMRRALLGELEGTCITLGIQESIHEILMNLKEIVLKGNLYETCNSFICAKGPGYVTVQDIILPPSMEIVDNTQHVASLTEPIDLCIGLQIKRNRGYGIKMPKNFHNGSYPIDVVFMPVRNANHSIHCYGNDNEKHEMLFSRNMDKWKLVKLIKKKNEIALKYIFIDQSKLPPRIYNCLKNREDLMKIEHFHIEDVKQILGILEKK
ncbi:hypothetical protein ES288_D08G166500v1 [Gossypium darwinii]|uniref:DNA-directed RNA polymerase insert domain-containing protein n=1 Tax=Gossypium darwinii TaxID=34276 RepID=A0A5D2BMQ6_GOSDA|nr:hypothetical protein ES288_D08G166500v1 [Gossypium darwinii]